MSEEKKPSNTERRHIQENYVPPTERRNFTPRTDGPQDNYVPETAAKPATTPPNPKKD
jgi:hypothetical protein